MFQYTTAIDKLRRLTKPIKVIQGGTSAGKTEGIIANYINECAIRSDIDLTVTAESIPALKDGALKIFKATMHYTKRWTDDHYNATDRIYTFSSGSKVQFKSFDTVGKAKAAGKRTHLFVNECQYVPFPIIEELMPRTYEEVIFDYNPNNPFYMQEEILPRDDAELLILTYKDNEATPPRVIEDFNRRKIKAFHDSNKAWDDPTNIKSKYHANWCRVYIRGEIGSLEGVIFSNWSIIEDVPQNARRLGYGLDFGYIHPAAWIGGYIHDSKRIFDEVISRSGLTNPQLAELMKDNGNVRDVTYADSAEPKSIEELSRYGITIKPVVKGADSVDFGISILQEEHFYVTARSTNLIKGLRQYCWDEDREGKQIQKPVKIDDDEIDAMRYLAMSTLSKSLKTRTRPMLTLGKFH